MVSVFSQRFVRFALGVGIVFSLPALSHALPEEQMSGSEYFERKVRPLLIKHCYDCHSEQEGEQKGGLLLDRESGWLEGGDSGKAVVPGQLGASLLIQAVTRRNEDIAMPPKYALEEEEINIFRRWIKDGAAGPIEDMGETEFSQLGNQEVIFEKAADHWAFQPVKKPELPAAGKGQAIDQLIFAKLKEKRLTPSEKADKQTLVRRLSYALTGLPPTDEKLFEMEIDQLVETLMDSPQFGEHVARMWLDVARYADTAGTYRPDTKTPHYYPYAFTYRDYVIDAFNADKPFNQFVKEQLAADMMEFAPNAPELAGVGFIGVSPHRNMSGDFVDDVIDATTRGFLGMTVSCARCHDHKFEPVPTADYYSLYGVFSSVNRPEPWKEEEFPEIKGYKPAPGELASYREERAKIDKSIEEAGKKKKGNNRSLAESIEQTDLAELLLFNNGAPARAIAITDRPKPSNPMIYIRGEPSNKGDRVPRQFLKILDPQQKPFSKDNSGRLEVAEKIIDPKNPLTARVYVNRIWGMLMGDYIVDTPSDFGLQGEAPSHPELLDYLAANFIENGWSTKHLVKEIVSSETFQQSSENRGGMEAIDPENEYYWRANRQRLGVEEMRDSYLAVSGNLDLKVHGRPEELWGDDYSHRRSIYGYINRFNQDPTLRNFDYPSPMQTQGQRTDNIVPPQALFLMNSPFIIDQAKTIVDKLGFTEKTPEEEKVTKIFEAALQRKPSVAEVNRIARFAEIENGRNVDPWPLLAQSLLMSNEFLYVD